jgi:hypothetical protein
MKNYVNCLSVIGANFLIDTSKSYIIDIYIKTISDTYLFTLKTPYYWNAIEYCFPVNDRQIKFVFPNKSGFVLSFNNFIHCERFPVDINLKGPLPEADKSLVFDFTGGVVRWINDAHMLELVKNGSQFEYRYRAFDSLAFGDGCILTKSNKEVFLLDNCFNEWHLSSLMGSYHSRIFDPPVGSFSLKHDNTDMVWLKSISTFLIWVKGACLKFKKNGDELLFIDFLPELNKVKSQRATYDKYNQILILHSYHQPLIYDCVSLGEKID